MKTETYNGISLILMILISLCACERRPLEEAVFDTARIPIGVVWDKAAIAPQNVSALFYREADGKLILEHRFEHRVSRIQSYAEVPPGKYTVIVFNELRNQIDYVDIGSFETLGSAAASAVPDPNPFNRVPGYSYIRQPGILAVAVVRELVVTPEMVRKSRFGGSAVNAGESEGVTERLVGIEPLRKTGEMHIRIHVRGLNNARMPVLVDLRNIGGACSLSEDKNTDRTVVCQFTINNRQYDQGSVKDGFVSGAISLFGMAGDRYTTADQPESAPLMLDMLFMLTDQQKTLVRHCIDITSTVSLSKMTDGSVLHRVEMTLQEPLPDVVPEGNGGNSGFGSDLVDWEVEDIPLISG